MNSDQLSNSKLIKWQRMREFIHQHQLLNGDLSKQFKRLWISRSLNENLFILLLQYIGIMLSGPLTPLSIAPLWFASGTASGFIFMRGLSILPGIFFGCFIAYLSSINILFAFVCAGLNTLQAFLLLKISYRFNIPTMIFYDKNKFSKFFLICMSITGLISFLLLKILYLTRMTEYKLISSLNYLQIFPQWWLGNLMGILVFACGIVSLDFYFSQIDRFNKIKKSFFYLLVILLLINCILLLFSQSPLLSMLLTLLTIPIILAFSMSFGWCGMIGASFVLGALLNFSAYLHFPLFATVFTPATLTFIQFIFIIEIVVGLSIAISQQKCVALNKLL